MDILGILKFTGLCLAAYLFGAIPFSYIFPKLIKGVDIREDGTGNVGISNAFVVGGPIAGSFAFVLEHLKPVLTMMFAYLCGWRFTGGFDLHTGGLWAMLILSVFTKMGHDFPIFLGFKGGKGLCVPYGLILFFGPFYWAAVNLSLISFVIPKNKNLKFKIVGIQILFILLIAGLLFLFENIFKGNSFWHWFGWRFTNLFPGGLINSTFPIAIFCAIWIFLIILRRCLFTGIITDIRAGVSPFRAIYVRAIFDMYPRGSALRNPGKELGMGEDDWKK